MIGKRRKIDNPPFKLVQLDLPLWGDLLSVIFQFTTDFTLNSLLRSSKRLLELVKKRAVFSDWKDYYVDSEESTKKKFLDFFFSSMSVEVEGNDVEDPLDGFFRQRFLKIVYINDLRVLCRLDSNQRPLFPYLEEVGLVDHTTCEKEEDENVEVLCEFLRGYPRRVSVDLEQFEGTGVGLLKKENLEKILENGKFDNLTISCHMFSRELFPKWEDFLLLRKLDARSFTFQGSCDVSNVMDVLAPTTEIERLVLDNTENDLPYNSEELYHMQDILLNSSNFKCLKEIVFIDVFDYTDDDFLATIAELARKRKRIQSIRIQLLFPGDHVFQKLTQIVAQFMARASPSSPEIEKVTFFVNEKFVSVEICDKFLRVNPRNTSSEDRVGGGL